MSIKLHFTLTRATDFDQHSPVSKNERLSLVLFCAQLKSHGHKVADEESCNTKLYFTSVQSNIYGCMCSPGAWIGLISGVFVELVLATVIH